MPCAVAQSKLVTGSIIDRVTNEPIPYVHVFTNGRLISMSDTEGDFTFRITNPGDSLTFSCIGYQTITLPLSDVARENPVVTMTEDRILLQTVTIRSLPAKDFIRKCIEKIPDNYDPAGTWKAFYWNATRFNELPTQFFESYLSVTGDRVTYDSISETVKRPEDRITLYDSLTDVLKFDVINQASMFVNPVNLNDWSYEYAYAAGQNEQFVVVEATMIQNPFQPTTEKNTLKIFINSNDYAIVRVDFSYRWKEGKRYAWRDDIVFALVQLDGTVEYRRDKQHYAMHYMSVETQFAFTRRYNPAILKTARAIHELVILNDDMVPEKPVVRWNDYLDAQKLALKP